MAAADLPVAILAGGLATRLQPVTATVPKSLVEVAGEPFLAHQLRLLRQSGLHRVIVCAGHLGSQIVDRFGHGSAFGVRLEYAFDGPALLGTGGALIAALPKLGEAFYVLYGDSYLPVNFLAVGDAFLRSGASGLMTVFENRGKFDRSNVQFERGRIVDYRKTSPTPAMHHIDYGLGVFRAAAFDGWPRDTKIDLAEIQTALVQRQELAGLEISQRFYEIGSPGGLKELDDLLRRGQIPRA